MTTTPRIVSHEEWLKAAQAHLVGCERCRSDSAAADAARRRFTTTVMPRTISSLRRPSWWSPLRRPALVLAPIFAAAMLALLLVPARHSSESSRSRTRSRISRSRSIICTSVGNASEARVARGCSNGLYMPGISENSIAPARF